MDRGAYDSDNDVDMAQESSSATDPRAGNGRLINKDASLPDELFQQLADGEFKIAASQVESDDDDYLVYDEELMHSILEDRDETPEEQGGGSRGTAATLGGSRGDASPPSPQYRACFAALVRAMLPRVDTKYLEIMSVPAAVIAQTGASLLASVQGVRFESAAEHEQVVGLLLLLQGESKKLAAALRQDSIIFWLSMAHAAIEQGAESASIAALVQLVDLLMDRVKSEIPKVASKWSGIQSVPLKTAMCAGWVRHALIPAMSVVAIAQTNPKLTDELRKKLTVAFERLPPHEYARAAFRGTVDALHAQFYAGTHVATMYLAAAKLIRSDVQRALVTLADSKNTIGPVTSDIKDGAFKNGGRIVLENEAKQFLEAAAEAASVPEALAVDKAMYTALVKYTTDQGSDAARFAMQVVGALRQVYVAQPAGSGKLSSVETKDADAGGLGLALMRHDLQKLYGYEVETPNAAQIKSFLPENLKQAPMIGFPFLQPSHIPVLAGTTAAELARLHGQDKDVAAYSALLIKTDRLVETSLRAAHILARPQQGSEAGGQIIGFSLVESMVLASIFGRAPTSVSSLSTGASGKNPALPLTWQHVVDGMDVPDPEPAFLAQGGTPVRVPKIVLGPAALSLEFQVARWGRDASARRSHVHSPADNFALSPVFVTRTRKDVVELHAQASSGGDKASLSGKLGQDAQVRLLAAVHHNELYKASVVVLPPLTLRNAAIAGSGPGFASMSRAVTIEELTGNVFDYVARAPSDNSLAHVYRDLSKEFAPVSAAALGVFVDGFVCPASLFEDSLLTKLDMNQARLLALKSILGSSTSIPESVAKAAAHIVVRLNAVCLRHTGVQRAVFLRSLFSDSLRLSAFLRTTGVAAIKPGVTIRDIKPDDLVALTSDALGFPSRRAHAELLACAKESLTRHEDTVEIKAALQADKLKFHGARVAAFDTVQDMWLGVFVAVHASILGRAAALVLETKARGKQLDAVVKDAEIKDALQDVADLRSGDEARRTVATALDWSQLPESLTLGLRGGGTASPLDPPRTDNNLLLLATMHGQGAMVRCGMEAMRRNMWSRFDTLQTRFGAAFWQSASAVPRSQPSTATLDAAYGHGSALRLLYGNPAGGCMWYAHAALLGRHAGLAMDWIDFLDQVALPSLGQELHWTRTMLEQQDDGEIVANLGRRLRLAAPIEFKRQPLHADPQLTALRQHLIGSRIPMVYSCANRVWMDLCDLCIVGALPDMYRTLVRDEHETRKQRPDRPESKGASHDVALRRYLLDVRADEARRLECGAQKWFEFPRWHKQQMRDGSGSSGDDDHIAMYYGGETDLPFESLQIAFYPIETDDMISDVCLLNKTLAKTPRAAAAFASEQLKDVVSGIGSAAAFAKRLLSDTNRTVGGHRATREQLLEWRHRIPNSLVTPTFAHDRLLLAVQAAVWRLATFFMLLGPSITGAAATVDTSRMSDMQEIESHFRGSMLLMRLISGAALEYHFDVSAKNAQSGLSLQHGAVFSGKKINTELLHDRTIVSGEFAHLRQQTVDARLKDAASAMRLPAAVERQLQLQTEAFAKLVRPVGRAVTTHRTNLLLLQDAGSHVLASGKSMFSSTSGKRVQKGDNETGHVVHIKMKPVALALALSMRAFHAVLLLLFERRDPSGEDKIAASHAMWSLSQMHSTLRWMLGAPGKSKSEALVQNQRELPRLTDARARPIEVLRDLYRQDYKTAVTDYARRAEFRVSWIENLCSEPIAVAPKALSGSLSVTDDDKRSGRILIAAMMPETADPKYMHGLDARTKSNVIYTHNFFDIRKALSAKSSADTSSAVPVESKSSLPFSSRPVTAAPAAPAAPATAFDQLVAETLQDTKENVQRSETGGNWFRTADLRLGTDMDARTPAQCLRRLREKLVAWGLGEHTFAIEYEVGKPERKSKNKLGRPRTLFDWAHDTEAKLLADGVTDLGPLVTSYLMSLGLLPNLELVGKCMLYPIGRKLFDATEALWLATLAPDVATRALAMVQRASIALFGRANDDKAVEELRSMQLIQSPKDFLPATFYAIALLANEADIAAIGVGRDRGTGDLSDRFLDVQYAAHFAHEFTGDAAASLDLALDELAYKTAGAESALGKAQSLIQSSKNMPGASSDVAVLDLTTALASLRISKDTAEQAASSGAGTDATITSLTSRFLRALKLVDAAHHDTLQDLDQVSGPLFKGMLLDVETLLGYYNGTTIPAGTMQFCASRFSDMAKHRFRPVTFEDSKENKREPAPSPRVADASDPTTFERLTTLPKTRETLFNAARVLHDGILAYNSASKTLAVALQKAAVVGESKRQATGDIVAAIRAATPAAVADSDLLQDRMRVRFATMYMCLVSPHSTLLPSVETALLATLATRKRNEFGPRLADTKWQLFVKAPSPLSSDEFASRIDSMRTILLTWFQDRAQKLAADAKKPAARKKWFADIDEEPTVADMKTAVDRAAKSHAENLTSVLDKSLRSDFESKLDVVVKEFSDKIDNVSEPDKMYAMVDRLLGSMATRAVELYRATSDAATAPAKAIVAQWYDDQIKWFGGDQETASAAIQRRLLSVLGEHIKALFYLELRSHWKRNHSSLAGFEFGQGSLSALNRTMMARQLIHHLKWSDTDERALHDAWQLWTASETKDLIAHLVEQDLQILGMRMQGAVVASPSIESKAGERKAGERKAGVMHTLAEFIEDYQGDEGSEQDRYRVVERPDLDMAQTKLSELLPRMSSDRERFAEPLVALRDFVCDEKDNLLLVMQDVQQDADVFSTRIRVAKVTGYNVEYKLLFIEATDEDDGDSMTLEQALDNVRDVSVAAAQAPAALEIRTLPSRGVRNDKAPVRRSRSQSSILTKTPTRTKGDDGAHDSDAEAGGSRQSRSPSPRRQRSPVRRRSRSRSPARRRSPSPVRQRSPVRSTASLAQDDFEADYEDDTAAVADQGSGAGEFEFFPPTSGAGAGSRSVKRRFGDQVLLSNKSRQSKTFFFKDIVDDKGHLLDKFHPDKGEQWRSDFDYAPF